MSKKVELGKSRVTLQTYTTRETMKLLKIRAIQEDKNVMEVVNEALQKHLCATPVNDSVYVDESSQHEPNITSQPTEKQESLIDYRDTDDYREWKRQENEKLFG